MSFIIQFTCLKCGYQTPGLNGKNLIDPLGMPNLAICSCRDCQQLFHRKLDENRQPTNECRECGSKNIVIHEYIGSIPCPVCGANPLQCECIGTCF